MRERPAVGFGALRGLLMCMVGSRPRLGLMFEKSNRSTGDVGAIGDSVLRQSSTAQSSSHVGSFAH